MSGFRTFFGLIFRRDRVKLPLWVVIFVGSLVSMVPLLKDVYGSDESLATVYATFNTNPAGLFITGPMDYPTFGAFMTLETLLWWGIFIAFMNTLLIVRHTRHNEEIGAQELLLSGQAHRSTGLVAALSAAGLMNAVISVGIGIGMTAVDAGWGVEGAWLYGIGMGLFGMAWASIAAVVVQLVESGRSANGVLAGLIGLGFVLRGIGDFLGSIGSSGLHEPVWVSYLSPFGVLQSTRPLTSPDWVPLMVIGLTATVLVVTSFFLLSRRDVGAGILPSKKGKVRASGFLKTPLGLTWYIQKNIFLGWLAGVVFMTATIGSLATQMGDAFGGSDEIRQMIEGIGGAGALIPSFMSAMLAIMTLMVLGYAVQSISRIRSEEARGHLENVLATQVSRIKWISLHGAVAMAGSTLMLALAGCMLAIFTNTLSDTQVDLWEYTLSGLSYAPIVLAFLGLYLLLFGIFPRLANTFTWIYFGFVATVSWLGPILQLEQSVMSLSVMEYTSSPPVEAIELMPLGIVALSGLVIAAIGVFAWRQRDLAEK